MTSLEIVRWKKSIDFNSYLYCAHILHSIVDHIWNLFKLYKRVFFRHVAVSFFFIISYFTNILTGDCTPLSSIIFSHRSFLFRKKTYLCKSCIEWIVDSHTHTHTQWFSNKLCICLIISCSPSVRWREEEEEGERTLICLIIISTKKTVNVHSLFPHFSFFSFFDRSIDATVNVSRWWLNNKKQKWCNTC